MVSRPEVKFDLNAKIQNSKGVTIVLLKTHPPHILSPARNTAGGGPTGDVTHSNLQRGDRRAQLFGSAHTSAQSLDTVCESVIHFIPRSAGCFCKQEPDLVERPLIPSHCSVDHRGPLTPAWPHSNSNAAHGHGNAWRNEKARYTHQTQLSSKPQKKNNEFAGGVLMMSGPIADIRPNIPQHLAVASPPTIKSSVVSDTGAALCALAHTQPCAFITPQPLRDRQD
ncbi:hypothetical protein NQZ68_003650 [Dissostichus eleginoides]|nr:hypothetical protein NQZ68_003650 [Dissostichus eleginoides]